MQMSLRASTDCEKRLNIEEADKTSDCRKETGYVCVSAVCSYSLYSKINTVHWYGELSHDVTRHDLLFRRCRLTEQINCVSNHYLLYLAAAR